jgi:hypothetical protein
MEEDHWVVCHSPLILLQFNSHVNVEYGASLELPVYFYKYFYKGPDFTGFKIDKSTLLRMLSEPVLRPCTKSKDDDKWMENGLGGISDL